MIKFKNNKNKKFKIILILLSVLLLIFLYLVNVVNPLIITTNKSGLELDTVNCINKAVSKSLSGSLYTDLITIEKDDNNKITLISCNSANVNKLSNNISQNCQEALKNLGETGYDISLLSFTGLMFLNGIGPKITIKTLPIGHIKTTFKSTFTNGGINQTLHQLYINITADVDVLLPINSTNITCSTDILIAESIIIGEIPNIYLSGNLLSNKLNLVP